MALVIGTSSGLFISGSSGAATPAAELVGQSVRHVSRVNGALFAGAESGVFCSEDEGRTWRRTGCEGRMVWDIAVAPDDPRTLYAGTQPAGLFRSRDGGVSWSEIESFTRTPGAETWCVPVTPPQPGRARTVAVDRADPARWWVGVEVGGVVASADGGGSWTVTLPGGNPDIHVLVTHPARPDVIYATTGYGRIDNREPMSERIAGLFGSEDGGRSWRYLWEGIKPAYTRPIAIDPRPPYALTVAGAPTAFSSYRDEGGAQAMLFQSEDGGATWRSIGDTAHAPSAANFHAIIPDPETAGGVLVGTDTGEVWRVTPSAEWTLVTSGLPMVQALALRPQ